MFQVTGIVEKADGKDPRDISIITRSPPVFPAPLIKKNISFDVWKEPSGKLPTLIFSHPAYRAEDIDLNDRKNVEFRNGELIIMNPIKLIPLS